MILILVRHGKAEERSPQRNDDDRELTKEGRMEMERNAQGLSALIDSNHPIVLLTSPLVRARQTAEYLQKELSLSAIETENALEDGSLQDFVRALKRFPEDATVIATGHEPFCSSWLGRITGTRVDFRKGAAAGIRIDRLSPLEGKLLFYLNPESLARMIS